MTGSRASRCVLLCDLDAFFAAVEVLDNPALAGKPVIVGGLGPRGVVSTCSYEARRFGVRSAMPMSEARRRCPQAVFLAPRPERYQEVARAVVAIYERYVPVIERVSIDEAYLDATGQDGRALAAAIRADVRRETGLAVSIGVGPNKLLAKLACELAKPDGLGEIRAEEAEAVLAPLAVDRIPGVGPRTAERLRELGIRTIGDLQRRPLAWLADRFGRRGEELYRLCRGIDDRPVGEGGPVRSLSEETTFDVDRPAGPLEPVLLELCERVGARLRAAGLRARTIGIKVRFPSFVTITRSHTQPQAVDDDLSIFRAARALYRTHVLERPPDAVRPRRGPLRIRLLGVQVSGLVEAGTPEQLGLWSAPARADRLSRAIDAVRARFGERALVRATRLLGDAQGRRPAGPGGAAEPE